ncbi:hypothetical protein H5079_09455 [Pseudoalteromonas sp. SG44-5]|uniref:Rho-binding antiterminator n=1 Tax=Pseudoalteromonas sp. SG44-5 TaxID=2760960 RepID=UPI0015F824D6|nr:Rho-binding antiterminator [Pseudoalteromonas sp. SG44-5]MBB1405838.1 hypothetical protein [Pseudoalteromonas sp. SG44-5]
MTYLPIKCGDYDQLELYCMRANKVAITLDTQTLVGVAKTLENIKGEGEFLVLQERANKQNNKNTAR